ncbi:MAG: hypothetical protein WC766_05670 [Patescibacteria group bacterium]|jgi:hypothetical protein
MSIQRVRYTGSEVDNSVHTRTAAETGESIRAQREIRNGLMIVTRRLSHEELEWYKRLYRSAKEFLSFSMVQHDVRLTDEVSLTRQKVKDDAEHDMTMFAQHLKLLVGDYGFNALFTKPSDLAAAVIAAYEARRLHVVR